MLGLVQKLVMLDLGPVGYHGREGMGGGSAGYGKGWAFSSSEKAAKEGVEWLSCDFKLQKNQSQSSVDISSGLWGKGNHRKPREETSAMIWVARAGD